MSQETVDNSFPSINFRERELKNERETRMVWGFIHLVLHVSLQVQAQLNLVSWTIQEARIQDFLLYRSTSTADFIRVVQGKVFRHQSKSDKVDNCPCFLHFSVPPFYLTDPLEWHVSCKSGQLCVQQNVLSGSNRFTSSLFFLLEAQAKRKEKRTSKFVLSLFLPCHALSLSRFHHGLEFQGPVLVQCLQRSLSKTSSKECGLTKTGVTLCQFFFPHFLNKNISCKETHFHILCSHLAFEWQSCKQVCLSA